MEKEIDSVQATRQPLDPVDNSSQQPQHRFLKPHIILIVSALTFFVCVVFLLFIQQSFLKKSQNISITTSPTPISDEITSLVDLPELFEKETWQWHIDFSNTHSLGKNVLNITGKGFVNVSKSLTGTQFTSSQEILDSQEMMVESEFFGYYRENLSALNWENTRKIGDVELDGINASGATGSLTSYIGVQGNWLRVVAFEYSIPPEQVQQGSFSCPCNITFRVFVSDLIVVDSLFHASNDIVVDEVDNLTDIPSLFPELEWQSEPETIRSKDFIYPPVSYNAGKPRSLYGRQFTAFEHIETGSFREKGNAMFAYYDRELRKRGWSNYTTVGDIRLGASGGDGPVGSSFGFIASNKRNVRAILVEYNQAKYDFCPCDVTYKVFVSDIVSLDQLLEEAKETSP